MYNSSSSFLAKSPHYIREHIHQREGNQIVASQSLSSLSLKVRCVQREEQHTVGFKQYKDPLNVMRLLRNHKKNLLFRQGRADDKDLCITFIESREKHSVELALVWC